MKLIKTIFLTGFFGNMLSCLLLSILSLIYENTLEDSLLLIAVGLFVINFVMGIQILFIYIPLYFITKTTMVSLTREEAYKKYLPFSFIPFISSILLILLIEIKIFKENEAQILLLTSLMTVYLSYSIFIKSLK